MATNRKAITVHGLPHALAAAAVATELSAPLLLLSSPGAASFAGPAWFLSLAAQTQGTFPKADIETALDCAGFSGHALASLREGHKTIIYDGNANEAVDDIARQLDARVLRSRPDSLDARQFAAPEDLDAALRDWLESTG